MDLIWRVGKAESLQADGYGDGQESKLMDTMRTGSLEASLIACRGELLNVQSRADPSGASKRRTQKKTVSALDIKRILQKIPPSLQIQESSLISAAEALIAVAEAKRKGWGLGKSVGRKITSTEKLIRTTAQLPDLRSGLLAQLNDLLGTSALDATQSKIPLRRMLCLAALTFSLAGPDCEFPEEDIHTFTTSLTYAILREPLACNIDPSSITPALAQTLAADISERLLDIKRSRQAETESFLRDLGSSEGSYLERLLGATIEGKNAGLRWINQDGEGIASLKNIGSWLGFTQDKKGPSPMESDVLVVFVVGGVTYKELKNLSRVLDRARVGNTLEIVFGATHVATEEHIVDSLFFRSI